MQERRKFTRKNVIINAVCLELGFEQKQIDVLIQNMGPEGACFLSKDKLDIDREIALEVPLDEGMSVSLRASVIWSMQDPQSQQFKIGINFLDVDTESMKKFIDFFELDKE